MNRRKTTVAALLVVLVAAAGGGTYLMFSRDADSSKALAEHPHSDNDTRRADDVVTTEPIPARSDRIPPLPPSSDAAGSYIPPESKDEPEGTESGR
jgi:hypothetical protein